MIEEVLYLYIMPKVDMLEVGKYIGRLTRRGDLTLEKLCLIYWLIVHPEQLRLAVLLWERRN